MPIMAYPFDATLKDLFTPSPEDLISVFGLSNIRPAVSLNIDLSTISAATDMAIGLGDPLQEIVDLNFQSGPDPKLAARCHLYNAALHFRFAVPVRSVIVLLRRKADSKELTGKLTYASGVNEIQFPYDVIRMWEQPAELFLKAGVNALPLATLCRLPKGRNKMGELRDIFREIARRLNAECGHTQAVRLMGASFILLKLQPRGEEMGSIITEEMIQESGIREILEGVWQREVEKERRALHRVLMRQGTTRFGPPSVEANNRLHSIQDAEHLQRLCDAILTASSWDELLSTP